MLSLNLVATFPRQSPLNGITLREPIDENLLDKCIHSDLLKTNYKDDKWFNNEKTQLEKFKECIDRDYANVEYSFPFHLTDEDGFGRVNPKGSLGLHSLTRETRHTLVKDKMKDVDIENAHLIILLQVLKNSTYKGSYKMVEDYVNNRQKWIDSIASAYKLLDRDDVKKDIRKKKEIAKNLILRITYGGSIDKWKKDWNIKIGTAPTEIRKLCIEVKGIFKCICEANPKLFEFCKAKNIEKKKDYNHEGTCASYFLQDKECLVLECVYQYCLDNQYIQNDICSLCNDGIMLEQHYYKPELLTELNKYVLEQTGFDLTFIEKPLDEGYGDILDNHLIFDLWKKPILDGEYADFFKLLYHHHFVCSFGNTYTYNGVYWIKDISKKNVMMNNQIDTSFKKYFLKRANYLLFDAQKELFDWDLMDEEARTKDQKKIIDERFKTKYYPRTNVILYTIEDHYLLIIKKIQDYISEVERYLRNVCTRDRLVKDICRVITRDWIEFDADENLLGFLNKVYDLKKGDWVKPHYSQYISMTTGWNWINGYSSKYKTKMDEILKQIFPNPEIRQHYLIVLSTGLFGRTIQKFFVAKGVGGNGKSVLDSMMMRAVGEYGYKLTSEAVRNSIKEGANPTIANLNNKRFVLVQEPDKKFKINTSTIKELTGDKELNCRTLYSTDTITRLKLTLLMECNDLPQLDESGDAMARRIDVSPFDSRFMTFDRYNELTEEELETGKYHLANPEYESSDFVDTHKQALMIILMEHFKTFQNDGYIMKPPQAVILEAKEYLKYSDDFFGWFSDKFEKKEGSVITFKSLWNKFNTSDYFMNMTKAEKRKFNQSHLKSVVQNNMFLKNHFKKNKKMYNGVLLLCDSIVGYSDANYYGEHSGSDDDTDDDTDNNTENIY